MKDYRINHLTIIGVGAEPGAVLPVASGAAKVLARGHYASSWLSSIGIENAQVIELFSAETGWVEQIPGFIDATDVFQSILYVTPLYPLAIDLIGCELAGHAREARWLDGSDVFSSLMREKSLLLNGSIQAVDVLRIHMDYYPAFSAGMPALVHTAGVKLDLDLLQRSLIQVYPAETPLYLLGEDHYTGEPCRETSLEQLGSAAGPFSAIFIPPCPADATLENFMQVIARLRAPDGCPWDRKQTHASLRPYLLEETYEALERLDNNDLVGLQEELGDLLLQIALHSQIASESNTFNITRVLQGINRKIVSRHPHVFASVSVRDDKDVVQNWEKIKEVERAGNGKEEANGLLDGIPQILPALSQAQSIQDRAARVGFDWPEIEPVIAKVGEEMQEVREAANENDRAGELGDLLFAVVNLVRWYGVDAESALRRTNLKFRKRFAYIESQAKKAGRELQKMTLEEMDKLWESAKEFDD